VEIEISSDETGETLKRTSQKLTARRHRWWTDRDLDNMGNPNHPK
jgi:hypothetical protein